jgi:hypothetical protein
MQPKLLVAGGWRSHDESLNNFKLRKPPIKYFFFDYTKLQLLRRTRKNFCIFAACNNSDLTDWS